MEKKNKPKKEIKSFLPADDAYAQMTRPDSFVETDGFAEMTYVGNFDMPGTRSETGFKIIDSKVWSTDQAETYDAIGGPNNGSQGLRKIVLVWIFLIGLGVMFMGQPEPLFLGFWLLLLVSHIPLLLVTFRLTLLKLNSFKQHNPSQQEPDPILLPFYTVLVPLYKEANMLEQIAQHLDNLVYPRDRLEVLILLEANDTLTRQATMRMLWPIWCHLVVVPKGTPQTKARACNYGLSIARGTYLVIYDAEDQPDPIQLKEATNHFRHARPQLACLQAPLDISLCQNWLQHQFALEYRMLFTAVLPVLAALRVALPLGGTSNHFKTSVLLELGGWDAHNLTEDADIGLRLARIGYETAILPVPTIENAPHGLLIWWCQRTRWLTGHFQTWYAHMRHPVTAWREFGVLSFFIVNLLMATRLFSDSVKLVFYTTMAARIVTGAVSQVSKPMIAIILINGLLNIFIAYTFSYDIKWRQRIVLICTHQFYRTLAAPAMVHALIRIILGKMDWLKTPHVPFPCNDENMDMDMERVKDTEPPS